MAVSDLREMSAEAAQVRHVSHDCGRFPQRAPQHVFQVFCPIKGKWRGQAVLVSAFGMPGEARRLSWQEKELPE